MNKDNIIIGSIVKSHEIKTYTGCAPICNITEIKVNFFLLSSTFHGDLTIQTRKDLTEEEIKDKIIEVINS